MKTNLGKDIGLVHYYHFIYSNRNIPDINMKYIEHTSNIQTMNKDYNTTKIAENNWYTHLKNCIDDSLKSKYLRNCNSVKDQQICPISQDIMEYPVKTKCNHIFDKKNIIRWIRINRSCPICKTNLDKVVD
jgi:hypothetical protein